MTHPDGATSGGGSGSPGSVASPRRSVLLDGSPMARGAIPSASRARRPVVAPPGGARSADVTPSSILERAARRVADRLVGLESRLDSGGDAAWPEYLDTVRALAALVPLLPASQGRLLTTAELAARLGVATKTLRKWRSAGLARPVLERGRVVRWNPRQALR